MAFSKNAASPAAFPDGFADAVCLEQLSGRAQQDLRTLSPYGALAGVLPSVPMNALRDRQAPGCGAGHAVVRRHRNARHRAI